MDPGASISVTLPDGTDETITCGSNGDIWVTESDGTGYDTGSGDYTLDFSGLGVTFDFLCTLVL